MLIFWSFSPSFEFYDCLNSLDIHRDSKFSFTHSTPVQKSSPFLYSSSYLVSSSTIFKYFCIRYLKVNKFSYSVSCFNSNSLLLFLGMVIFASLVYYAERLHANPKNDFKSIPEGLWWEFKFIAVILDYVYHMGLSLARKSLLKENDKKWYFH